MTPQTQGARSGKRAAQGLAVVPVFKTRDDRPRSMGDKWGTDQVLFADLHAEFLFTIDVAADSTNHRVARYYTEKEDGLKQDWSGERVWCNPPYSFIDPWVAKAARREAQVAVLMLPVRTDRPWWHEHIWDAERNRPRDGVEIRWALGRVKFYGAKQTPTWPTAVVIFWGEQA